MSTQTVLPEVPLPLTSTVVPKLTLTGTAISRPTVEPTSAPTRVEVIAKGNLFVRRGPDLAFNPISVLPKRQTAFPNGRDVLARWLRIPLPGDSSSFGWISIMSEFTEVIGEVNSLPEIEPTDWPELAFVRNCTHHQMMIEPAGILMPSIQYFPENDVRVNPGSYSVLDMDIDDYPEVLRIEIREGSAIDIIVDGNGEKKKCPTP